MTSGARFDDLIKAHLIELYGLSDQTFESSVEVEHPEAMARGDAAFEAYVDSSAMTTLLKLIDKLGGLDLVGDHQGNITPNVPGRGKPDIDVGGQYILDWKCNGLMSQASPVVGYVEHPKHFHQENEHGLMVNISTPLRERRKGWALQAATYYLLRGYEPPFTLMIHQLCGRKDGSVRVYQHNEILSKEYVDKVKLRYEQAWSYISTEHYFPELSKEASDAKLEEVEKACMIFQGDTEENKWRQMILRRS
tara:strand:+ start:67856 stop:68605 length:750 start_codon:yes stop_codon:yes gene_type:complete